MDLVNAWRTRMKLLVSVFPLLLAPYLLAAQAKPPALMSGLGQHHHVISTKRSEAQRFFDQGHGGEADFRTEVTRVPSDFEQCLGTGPEQQTVDDLLVLQSQPRDAA